MCSYQCPGSFITSINFSLKRFCQNSLTTVLESASSLLKFKIKDLLTLCVLSLFCCWPDYLFWWMNRGTCNSPNWSVLCVETPFRKIKLSDFFF